MNDGTADWRADLMAEIEKETGIPTPRSAGGSPILTRKYIQEVAAWEIAHNQKESPR